MRVFSRKSTRGRGDEPDALPEDRDPGAGGDAGARVPSRAIVSLPRARPSLRSARAGGAKNWLAPSVRSRGSPGGSRTGGGARVNGFDVEPELPALLLEPRHVAALSLPEELLEYTPSDEAVATRFRSGEVQRNLHCNVELTQDEQQKLGIMREAAKAQGLVFTPSLATAASRYLGRARNDPKRALKEMVATQEWRHAYFQGGSITDKSVEDDLAHGIVYLCGRDKWMRPLLVLRPARIPDAWYHDKRSAADRLVRLLVFCIEYMLQYMLFPGRVEGGVALMDLSGLTLSQLPFGPLRTILSLMANHYVNRIFRFYILNLPPALGVSAQLGLRLLSERQRQKLQIVKHVGELRQEFALHQLESDLGGSRPLLEAFLPFPLPPGPFEAGCSEGPRPGAVPELHAAFTPACFLGRVWDPRRSVEENTRLELSGAAGDILGRRGGELLGGPLEPAGASRTNSPESLAALRGHRGRGASHDAEEVSPAGAGAQAKGEEWERVAAPAAGPQPIQKGGGPTLLATPLCVDSRSTTASCSDASSSKRASTNGNGQVVLEETEVLPASSFWCMPLSCTHCTA